MRSIDWIKLSSVRNLCFLCSVVIVLLRSGIVLREGPPEIVKLLCSIWFRAASLEGAVIYEATKESLHLRMKSYMCAFSFPPGDS